MEKEMQLPIEHHEDVLHIFGIEGIDMGKVWPRVRDIMEGSDFPGTIRGEEYDTEDGIKCHYEVTVKGHSAQGLHFFLYDNDIAHIEIPWLASLGDVELAFSIIFAMQEQFPELVVFLNDNTENPIAINAQNKEALQTYRVQNMVALLKHKCEDDGYIGIPGINHTYILPTIDKDCSSEELEENVCNAFNKFIEIQWRWEDYNNSGLGRMKMPKGNDDEEEEEVTTRFLANEGNTFVGISQKISVMTSDESIVKLVDSKYFMKKMEGNPYYERVDQFQFTMKVMPPEEWNFLVENLDGQEFAKPKTFILKWNPAISSFKYENYREAYAQCPNGFSFNWSIHEWQKAKKGDHFYMIRVGEGQTGAVWCGVFTSDPYKAEDWSGKGREVYYMDMDIYELNEPDTQAYIPTEELQDAIPEVDWTKGHSGMLLTYEQAYKLDKLWEKAVTKRNT